MRLSLDPGGQYLASGDRVLPPPGTLGSRIGWTIKPKRSRNQQGCSQLGEFRLLYLVGSNIYQGMLCRLMVLAAFDQRLQVEQGVADRSIRPGGIAEDDFGLLEHPLGGELPGALRVGFIKRVACFNRGLLP